MITVTVDSATNTARLETDPLSLEFILRAAQELAKHSMHPNAATVLNLANVALRMLADERSK